MPGRGLLVCVSDSQERFLVERPSPDLEPDRQSIAGEPAGNRDRRKRRESERVKRSGRVSVDLIASMFGIAPAKVRLFHYDPAYAIKATVPRFTVSGDPDETDVFAGQQYAQLVDLEIPDDAGGTAKS